jgi:hypothetical protein
VAYGRPQIEPRVIEHDSTPGGRWLRERRLRIAIWIAVIEGVLVAFKVISWWVAVPLAAIAIAFYLYSGRDLKNDRFRNIAWIAATSQALVALVPVLVVVVGTLALIAVAALAGIALFMLLTDRR